MARKELNVFGASFLDLLSGALGAVILLYIIVPKMDITQNEYDAQKKFKAKADSLGLDINNLGKYVPDSILNKVNSQMNAYKKAGEELAKNAASARKEAEDLREYKDWMDNCNLSLEDDCPEPAPPTRTDVGFKFKGKNIVFIIDLSGSMTPQHNDDKEDRIGKVKAGITLLINIFPSDYKSDAVSFWSEQNSGGAYIPKYESGWGYLKELTSSNKDNLIRFVSGLEAAGGTPTAEALKYVLTNSGYDNVTDIVLFSDGTPSSEGVTTQDIIDMTVKLNKSNIRINCIAVGKSLVRNSSDSETQSALKFMSELAKANNGFFYVN